MTSLYHLIPTDFRGEELMPLNQLKTKHPEIYVREIKKYEGREHLLDLRIPTLDCLWNDVLHFTAVHPFNLLEAFQDLDFPSVGVRKWFAVDLTKFEPENTTVFRYDLSINTDSEEQFIRFDPEDLANYTAIPQETTDYFRKMREEGKMPLLFRGIPHILYRGRFTKKDLVQIELEDNHR